VIAANLRRISRQPVVRNVAPAEEEACNNDGDAQRGTIFAATLSANPTDHCMCSGLGCTT
jgi:hypothetical protein